MQRHLVPDGPVAMPVGGHRRLWQYGRLSTKSLAITPLQLATEHDRILVAATYRSLGVLIADKFPIPIGSQYLPDNNAIAETVADWQYHKSQRELQGFDFGDLTEPEPTGRNVSRVNTPQDTNRSNPVISRRTATIDLTDADDDEDARFRREMEFAKSLSLASQTGEDQKFSTTGTDEQLFDPWEESSQDALWRTTYSRKHRREPSGVSRPKAGPDATSDASSVTESTNDSDPDFGSLVTAHKRIKTSPYNTRNCVKAAKLDSDDDAVDAKLDADEDTSYKGKALRSIHHATASSSQLAMPGRRVVARTGTYRTRGAATDPSYPGVLAATDTAGLRRNVLSRIQNQGPPNSRSTLPLSGFAASLPRVVDGFGIPDRIRPFIGPLVQTRFAQEALFPCQRDGKSFVRYAVQLEGARWLFAEAGPVIYEPVTNLPPATRRAPFNYQSDQKDRLWSSGPLEALDAVLSYFEFDSSVMVLRSGCLIVPARRPKFGGTLNRQFRSLGPQPVPRLVIRATRDWQQQQFLWHDGYDVSHLCHNWGCIAPWHLLVEPKPHNTRRNRCGISQVCSCHETPPCAVRLSGTHRG